MRPDKDRLAKEEPRTRIGRRNGRSATAAGDGRGTQARRDGLAAMLPARLQVSDATIARLSATLLWVLVILAAYGGITAWMGSGESSSADVHVPAPGDVPDGRWAAAGFAERYIAAYLTAGSDGSVLEPYLGYTPELPPTADPATSAGPVRSVDVERADQNRQDYWSVTVAVGSPLATTSGDLSLDTGATEGSGASSAGSTTGTESFWQVGVDTSGGQPVAVGLPAPVAAPSSPDRVPVAVTLSRPPADDLAVDSVEGFLGAYLCGAPDLDRYLHPEAVLSAAGSPICDTVEVVRWGSVLVSASGDGGEGTTDPNEARQTVVAEVVFDDSGSQARRATYGLSLAQRDGRWEVAELLPAPPLKER